MLSEEKVKKLFKVKITKNKLAKEKLKINKKPTATFGLYYTGEAKDKLVGICAYYPVSKKEWKIWKKISKTFLREHTFEYEKKISKKYSKNKHIDNFFKRKVHFICRKKFSEIINVSLIKR